MYLSPTNNSKPSFRGVMVPNALYKTDLTSAVVFRIIPDDISQGILYEDIHLESIDANILTKMIFYPLRPQYECVKRPLRKIIKQLGLPEKYKTALLELINDTTARIKVDSLDNGEKALRFSVQKATN